MEHMKFLKTVLDTDQETLIKKERTYQGSWKKRGGIGAFMMIARKWDRLENIASRYGWDIFTAVRADVSGTDGSALAEIRDLRCYLTLVEAQIISEKQPSTETIPIPRLVPRHVDGTPKEDSNRHASDAIVPAQNGLEAAIFASQSEGSKEYSD